MNRLIRAIASKSGLIQNPNYLLVLAFFNAAVLMNYHDTLWRRPIVVAIVFIMVGFTFKDYKNWWAALLTIGINFGVYIGKFPRLANHSNLELFICMAFLTLFSTKFIQSNFRIPPRLISNLFRVSLVTIYFYTGFHKLNTDFFNPCTSCVNQINEQVFENFTGHRIPLSAAMSRFFQYTTIFVEMVLPFGLFWHRSRTLTAIFLLGFHFYLGFAVFADFEAFAAFMILGATLDFEKTLDFKIVKALKIYLFLVLLVIFLKPFLFKFIKDSNTVNFIHGSLFNIGIAAFFIVYFIKNKSVQSKLPRKYLAYPLLCALLLNIWAVKAYFGFGNLSNLTMFSNLITESNRGNHLLIDTRKTKIGDLEEDSVLILKLHDTLKNYGFENHRLPMTEFRYQAKTQGDRYPTIQLNCTFVYQGDTITVSDLRNSEYAVTKWWYHYLNFRKIQPEGPNKCLW